MELRNPGNYNPNFVIILKNTSNTFFSFMKKTAAFLKQGIRSEVKRNLKLHAKQGIF